MALIDKTTIKKYRQISNSLRDEKINPHIEDAELLDLRPLLGEEFYYELVEKVEDEDDLYTTKLLSPYTYTYDGKKYRHFGIERVLSLFAYARYKVDPTTDTPFGTVEKRFNDGIAAPSTTLRDIYKRNQQEAAQYFNDIQLYLNRNNNLYPTWRSGCSSSRISGGFRISKITKS